jgi:hypothetical protein
MKLLGANTYGLLLMSQKSDPILLRQRLGQNNLIRTFRQAKYSKGLLLSTSKLDAWGILSCCSIYFSNLTHVCILGDFSLAFPKFLIFDLRISTEIVLILYASLLCTR